MHIRDLSGKSICILGYGREGQAMLKALEEHAPGCEITVADQDAAITLPKGSRHWLQVGDGWLKNLDKFDVLIKSPGIPPHPVLEAYRSALISPTQIFFDSIRDSGAMVIGVTGSKGKSTTASLLYHILQTSQPAHQPTSRILLVGNIGEPAIAHLKDAAPGTTCGERSRTIFVMEMSSYQLMDLTTSPHLAVVTSFFPEHLDYHGSVEAYGEAKKHIARFQTKEDTVFFMADSAGTLEIAKESRGKRIPFSAADTPVAIGETQLIGTHNLGNIAAAFLVSQELGVEKEIAVAAIRSFTPLPHRLQSLGIKHDIEWVDDSISTTPQSAIAALDALGDRVATIILGGLDRGYDFSPLAERLTQSTVQTVILLPESGKRIGEALKKATAHAQICEAKNMEEAVTLAKQHTRSPIPDSRFPIVLLSPASPSYGHFKNFEDRGEQFARAAQ
ncbi:MAG TPA: UDP-N-acetylmuramoyl-L-alanine--D-glutamate ligase [Candidatus Peribacter riflensis]|uniref:UDP-N-acetylmuramoylalanine--D-glutamate ligase n=1 Tax=Candidatus Peribacter riflensis TaxID=1735162 RepID=A0A0S1SQN3_9BACT|nr:MAG: UDP-N-acetylmuramoyl-L-alanyl-D-glutamate synthetase [Candidatus Peribacter riflensis]OGJ79090.1 MAG: UDP-N-acetylmuramoylalanine--D-glutamate ligase [Candidatus Peribacteria bacterium RIFOXYB1_FULL_57_12]OGJ80648.1 MAG: UDP-N-acetylmuramoylalanine--D-glutamate ligase [Candidatus Peribacteria bacterium RIFOXYC1_FULL_58_8]ALM11084.1 MAG: UDP-N-acetylmuramoyl-L-alanyl-D-glutamate synthetase [Candidatus Peribacter riflensis]ALM12187.1 MAG: UDP-N-acetylmuramoyl-L-alanyl-D-glutamate syntheta